MTLLELMVAAAVMSLVAVTLGGLVQAVETSRTYVGGMQNACSQGQFAIERIESAVHRAGTYRTGTGATVVGVAVVWESDRPETLVVWTGGREGTRAGQEAQDAPSINELVIFTPDPDAPHRLVEIAVPTATGDIDFTSAGFASRIRQIIANSYQSERVTICDRVRVVGSATSSAAAIRFTTEVTPDQSAVSTTAPGTIDWRNLRWYGGISSSSAGLRHLLVRIELQVLTGGVSGDPSSQIAMPVFGAASRRYFFERG